jgi:pimeloyl-ACP methyl ester carboxylesterase
VAICPASSDGLWRGLRGGELDFPADVAALEPFLAEHPLDVEHLAAPLLLLHAEGDERVPVAHSRELARIAPNAELVVVPGGHHRSVQHDAELQGHALRWLRKVV